MLRTRRKKNMFTTKRFQEKESFSARGRGYKKEWLISEQP